MSKIKRWPDFAASWRSREWSQPRILCIFGVKSDCVDVLSSLRTKGYESFSEIWQNLEAVTNQVGPSPDYSISRGCNHVSMSSNQIVRKQIFKFDKIWFTLRYPHFGDISWSDWDIFIYFYKRLIYLVDNFINCCSGKKIYGSVYKRISEKITMPTGRAWITHRKNG